MMLIRDLATTDVPAVADLLGQLGYPADPSSIVPRLRAMAAQRIARAWVAVADGQVVGLASAHVFAALHADAPTAYLSALVVSRESRRGGAGRSLVAHAEAWARSVGATRLSVSVGTQREGAHAFYRQLGFERTGFRYARQLSE